MTTTPTTAPTATMAKLEKEIAKNAADQKRAREELIENLTRLATEATRRAKLLTESPTLNPACVSLSFVSNAASETTATHAKWKELREVEGLLAYLARPEVG